MKTIGIVLIVVGIVFFIIGSATGTITGYQGANGLYYSNANAVGSNEWMCMPAFIIAIVGVVLYAKGKKKEK